MAYIRMGSRGGGGGGPGGGGIPAAFLPETGLSADDFRDHRWKGLFIGLERADGGADWKLTRTARNPTATVQAKTRAITVSAAAQSGTVTVTIPAAVAVGAAGNAWNLVVASTSLQDHVLATVDAANRNINVDVGQHSSINLDDLAAAIEAVWPGSTVKTGTTTIEAVGFNAMSSDFSGGVTEQAIGATVDADTKTVSAVYDAADSQQALVDALSGLQVDADTILQCVALSGTTLASAPVTAPGVRPFDQFYSPGSLPVPTDAAIDARIDMLTAEVEGSNIVFSLGANEVMRLTEAEIRDLLTRLGVIHA